MSAPAVIVDGVWKKFRRGERHDTITGVLSSAVKRLAGRTSAPRDLESQEFWAVRDVSFEVRPGEALGIIGPNGAGKSTILKLLSRILKPTRGVCEVRGRTGALIEVAAGFHPDLTGRENVFLQGAIMGMKRADILRKFDEIVEFAGVADFIDTQVKRYSSGMNARLGFAIAAHLDPDVLLIDEVLSVGDAAFQDRCVERMRELIGRGIPLVFISHNLPAILELCTRAIVIDHGTVRFDGDPATATQQYRLIPWAKPKASIAGHVGPISIVRAELLGDHGTPSAVFQTMAGMRVRVAYEAHKPIGGVSIAVDIHRADGVYCAGINTMMDRRDLGTLNGAGHVDLVLPSLNLLPGCYLVSVGILDAVGGRSYDSHLRAYPFSVMSDRRDLGVLYLEHHWTHEAAPASAPADVESPDAERMCQS